MITVSSRKKDERGVFAIFLAEKIFREDNPDLANFEAILGRVRARTHSEAEKIAVERGLGAAGAIRAVEVLDDSRVTAEGI